MSTYNIGYNFKPGETVWVVLKQSQSVKKGTCLQVNIKIYQQYGGPTLSPVPIIVESVKYLVLLDENKCNGTVEIEDSYIFSTIEDALAALGTMLLTPTPSPTPFMTPSPTPSITPSRTPVTTPTVTPTPSSL